MSWWTGVRWSCLGCLLAFFPQPVRGADAPAGITPVATIEGIAEYRLDNGLQVLLLADDSKPTVTINITYFVGSRHEGAGEAGMAHLLEHLLFKGTPSHPNIPAALKERGAISNGTTWVDRTNYYETLPASDANLEFALRLEADRMINSHIAEADLKSEMTVVRNEFEMGENSPQSILYQRMLATAFEWHSYGRSTIGNRSDIERVPIRNLQEFYRRHYQPDNAMLIVAGKFDEELALARIVEYFGPLEKSAETRNTTYTEEPPQDGERSVRLRRVGSVPLAGVTYHIPAGGHEELPAVEVLQRILTTEVSGRLYKRLVQGKLAAEVGGETLSLHDPGVLVILAQAAGEVTASQLLEALLATIDETAASGVTAEEVTRVQGAMLKERELLAANSSELAIQLSEWAAQGDWRLYFLFRDRLEQVTAEQVSAAAAKYLKPDNRTVGLFEPTPSPDRTAIPQLTNLKQMLEDYQGREDVAAGEQFDATPENIDARTQRVTLRSGIRGALLPKQTRGNSVTLRLALKYGSLETLQGVRTAAEFLPTLLTRGTRALTRQQIDDELDRLRAEISATGKAGEVVVTIQARRQTLPEVLSLLRQMLREPSFPLPEFELLKQGRLAQLEEAQKDPQMLAVTAGRRHVAPYPVEDPRYVPQIAEEIRQIKSLALPAVTGLYQRFLGGTAGELTIVGDFDPAETLPALESLLDGWKSKERYQRIVRQVPSPLQGGLETIVTPDKENAVYIGRDLFPVRDSDPEFAALTLGNYLLGDEVSQSSRLSDRIREKEGLTYGVMSMLQTSALDPYANFIVFAMSNPQNMPQVQKLIAEEIGRLLNDEIPAEELAQAKQGWLQIQQVERAEDASLAALLAINLQADRTMQYYADLEKQVSALSANDIQQALRKHISLKRLFVCVAGDFEKGSPPQK